jgi:chromosome segregation ATPase
MDGNEIITALNEVRDEVRQTNVRLDENTARLDENTARLGGLEVHVDAVEHRVGSLEGRVDSLEGRVGSLEGRVGSLEDRVEQGFAGVNARLDLHEERLDALGRQMTESEMRLATEIVSLASVTYEVRDLLLSRQGDHAMLFDHEHRIKTLEARDAARNHE